jgi:GntR family transcriptional repressor for pyruvate dehydrogenase complex
MEGSMRVPGSLLAEHVDIMGGGDAGDRERRPTLAAMVRGQVLEAMLSGRLKPGDHLPTEPEMMKSFGVSRGPIREAMQSLSLLGIVDVSPRRGAFVRALPVQSVIDLAMLSSVMGRERPVDTIYEFRYGTEPPLAALAAKRITDDQVEELRSIVAANAAAVESGDFAQARLIDVRFHAEIAVSCGNAIFQAVGAALNGLLIELRRTGGSVVGASALSLVEHRQIFEAIARHDPTAAREATEVHILNSQRRYAFGHQLTDGRADEA